jgi:ABC-type transport system involved in cytochrome bd biosynthesis fused ATPase/permease subunit
LKGHLIGIVGPVGSGKSTILMGILGENAIQGAPIQINAELMANGFAYVGQDVWLREGSVRENILCGRPFDQAKFEEAIWACALGQDIQAMPAQENYRISGEGKTLSGGEKMAPNLHNCPKFIGQKVRLALARALYADKPVYLLDDPFASLDRTVGQFVFQNYVQNGLIAKGKLVILCTHHEAFLREADLCIRLGTDGKVAQIGG